VTTITFGCICNNGKWTALSVRGEGLKGVPTKYSTMVQPHKKLPTISPSYGIKLVTKKEEETNIMCMLLIRKGKQ